VVAITILGAVLAILGLGQLYRKLIELEERIDNLELIEEERTINKE
jgi:hypothetical protein